MGKPILLFVWLFVSRLSHCHHLMCRDLRSHDIFSTMRRRLSLVVAFVCHIGRMRSLCIFLFDFLLRHWGMPISFYIFCGVFNLFLTYSILKSLTLPNLYLRFSTLATRSSSRSRCGLSPVRSVSSHHTFLYRKSMLPLRSTKISIIIIKIFFFSFFFEQKNYFCKQHFVFIYMYGF